MPFDLTALSDSVMLGGTSSRLEPDLDAASAEASSLRGSFATNKKKNVAYAYFATFP